MKNILIILAIILFPGLIFANGFDNKIQKFSQEIKLKRKARIVIGEILNLNTGREGELSKKIRNSLSSYLKERFTILERSMEDSLKKEQEMSISGYSISKSDYLLTGIYEIGKSLVKIDLKIVMIENSELIIAKTIWIDRQSVEIYLTDYSEEELDLIIDRQNKEIRSLLKKQQEQRKKTLKLQHIKQQRTAISRIKKGDNTPFEEEGNYKPLYIAAGTAWFGVMNYSAARNIERKEMKGAGSARMLGNISYLVSAWFIYSYLSENHITSLRFIPSSNKIALELFKRF